MTQQKFDCWVDLPAECRYVAVADIEPLLRRAIERANTNSVTQLEWGYSGKKRIDDAIQRRLAAGQLRVFASEGKGVIPDCDFRHGYLRRDDFSVMVAEDFDTGTRCVEPTIKRTVQDAALAVPHFVTSARPPCVPPDLLELNDLTPIIVEIRIGGLNENGYAKAGVYRAMIQGTIARQREGLFTVAEAAQAPGVRHRGG